MAYLCVATQAEALEPFDTTSAIPFSPFSLNDAVESAAYDQENIRLALASHSGVIQLYEVQKCMCAMREYCHVFFVDKWFQLHQYFVKFGQRGSVRIYRAQFSFSEAHTRACWHFALKLPRCQFFFPFFFGALTAIQDVS